MEDPWAAGPSWGSSSTPTPTLPKLEEPETTFDVSDPWGSGSQAVSSHPAPLPRSLSPPPLTESPPETPGWDGGADISWEGKDQIASHAQEQDEADEDVRTPQLNSPASPTAINRPPTPIQGAWEPSVQLQSPSLPANDNRPGTPSEGGWGGDERPFTPPSPPSMDLPTRTDEAWGGEDLEQALEAEKQPPKISFTPPAFDSPKFDNGFGDEGFGGFSSTVNAFSHDMADEDDAEDEGEGWGRVRAPVIMPGEQREERDQEEDWEEAQRRLREAEERVVSGLCSDICS